MNPAQPIVAVQGIAGSFHEMAAHDYFGPDIETVDCLSFKQVCDTLKRGEADYCVMAIENTIAGSLLPNYTLLLDYHFKIIGEVYLPIHMHLLANPGVKLKDVRWIQSHPIAIQQCMQFIWTLEDVEIHEMADTAIAAKDLHESGMKDTAAIANEASAQRYELDILRRDIETKDKNFTRFLVLSNFMIQREEHNKASLSLVLDHHPGSLADVLDIFRENRINLSKIQSLPVLDNPMEIMLQLDIEFERKEDYERAISQTLKIAAGLNILGEYKRADRPAV